MTTFTVLLVRSRVPDELTAQEQECLQYAKRQGITVDEVFRDPTSALQPGRPEFRKLLRRLHELLESGMPVELLCLQADRLFRDVRGWREIERLLDRGLQIRLVKATPRSGSKPFELLLRHYSRSLRRSAARPPSPRASHDPDATATPVQAPPVAGSESRRSTQTAVQ